MPASFHFEPHGHLKDVSVSWCNRTGWPVLTDRSDGAGGVPDGGASRSYRTGRTNTWPTRVPTTGSPAYLGRRPVLRYRLIQSSSRQLFWESAQYGCQIGIAITHLYTEETILLL
jgi:hypothetical protein